MADRRWYLTGVVGVGLYLVAQAFTGLLPEPDSLAAEVSFYLADHRAGVLTGAALSTVAAVVLLVFADRLRRAMDQAEGGDSVLGVPMLISWAILFTVLLCGQLPLLTIARLAPFTGSPDVTLIAFETYNLSLYAGSAAFAAMSILGPSVVAWRTGFLPRWLVAIGALEVLLNLVELAGISTRRGWNAAGYAFGVGPVVWVAWVASASVVLYRRDRPTTA